MDRAVEIVAGLGPELIEGIVGKLVELEPSTIAILISGSYAKEVADESSDLDVQVVTADEPSSPYRMWFENRPGSTPLHVSPSVKSLGAWLRKRDEPQDWAFGFPVEHVVRYVWATDDARAMLGDPPTNTHPPAEPELEDFVEFVGKVRRCHAKGDVVGVRFFARALAFLAPRLIQPVNEVVLVHDPREALDAALSLSIAPAHYRDDMIACLGLIAVDDDRVYESAMRLSHELLTFLRERRPDVDPQPDITRYLIDGTLERHLGFIDS
jgi:phosphoribosyl-AMP cyclohydrolase